MIAYIEDVPGDGTCMFHAVGVNCGYNGHELRTLVCNFMNEHLDHNLHGQSIRNWIEWDYNKKAEQYLIELEKGKWGGALELTLLSTLIRKPISVYVMKSKNKCEKISDSLPDITLPMLSNINFKQKNGICVLYANKNHYMALHTKI